MSERAAQAARELSAVLLAEAENLTSDELATISAAMTAVRAAARELESALTARGWGGDVLYGWGDSPFDEDDEDEDEDEDHEEFDDQEVQDDWPEVGEEEPWTVPDGVRMSYQARYDFVVVDEEALLDYVERTAADAGSGYTREAISVHGPVFILSELRGFGGMDFDGTGLVFAGGQDTVRPVEMTLYEIEGEAREDQFPTS